MRRSMNSVFIIAFLLSSGTVCLVSGSNSKPVIKADKIEFHRKDNFTFFSGNVLFQYGNNYLSANFIRKDDLYNSFYAYSNVRTSYNTNLGEVITSTSQIINYDSTNRKVTLQGNPVVLYKSTTSEIIINADRIIVDEISEEATFDNNVSIKYQGQLLKSPHAIYSHRIHKFYMFSDENSTDVPTLFYSGNQRVDFKAREITMSLDSKKFIFKGEASCRLHQ